MFIKKTNPLCRMSRVFLIMLGLAAMAGCRYAVQPAWIFETAEVGQTVSDTITITNTGETNLRFALSSSHPDVELSVRGRQTLSPGRNLVVSASATCRKPGVVRENVLMDVDGLDGGARTIPFELLCHAAGAARLVSIEIFQGPPVWKKNFETGRVDGWVSMARPEDGSPAVQPVPPLEYRWERYRIAVGKAWKAHDYGFVTAIWRRQAAVAIAVRHADPGDIPDISVDVAGPDGGLTPLGANDDYYQETHPVDGAWVTDTVLHMPRGLYVRGARLRVFVGSGSERIRETVPLSGEEVDPLHVTFAPIIFEEVPEVLDIDPDLYARLALLPALPIGDYRSDLGEVMVYRPPDPPDPSTPDTFFALEQLDDHRALHACDPKSVYLGVYNWTALREAGHEITGSGVANRHGFTAVAGVSGDLEWSNSLTLLPHEMGHLFGLDHAPCGVRYADPDYPYPDALLGPARSWLFKNREFVGRTGERGVDDFDSLWGRDIPHRDVMSYCPSTESDVLSDYQYQRALLNRQSTENWDARTRHPFSRLERDDCTGEEKASGVAAKSSRVPRSIAITGSVDADGVASVRMARPTNKPAWGGPASGDLILTVLDSGGGELHRQPLRTGKVWHSGGLRFWSARVPYFEDAAEVIVRSAEHGDLRASRNVRTVPENTLLR